MKEKRVRKENSERETERRGFFLFSQCFYLWILVKYNFIFNLSRACKLHFIIATQLETLINFLPNIKYLWIFHSVPCERVLSNENVHPPTPLKLRFFSSSCKKKAREWWMLWKRRFYFRMVSCGSVVCDSNRDVRYIVLAKQILTKSSNYIILWVLRVISSRAPVFNSCGCSFYIFA